MTALSTWSSTFRVFDGTTEVTTGHGVVYSVVSQTNCTVAINSSTGVITCSAITADTASAVFQAVYHGVTLQKTESFAKSRAGSDGLPAKLLKVNVNRQTVVYDTTGAPNPTSQNIVFSAVKQNSTATVSWSVADANGVARTPTTTYLSAASGNSVTMTETQFASARNGTSGVIVTGTMTDGSTFTDTVSVVRVADGAAGAPAITGLLTNEAVTVGADSAGTVGSFSAAGGTFKVFNGTTDVTTSAAFSVAASAGVTISINATTGVYSVTAMSADTANATLRAVYSGVTIDKIYTISKSKTGTTGSNGADAKILTILSDRQTISYNTTGAPSPTTQTTTFTAVKQNSTATVSWTLTDAAGVARTPVTTYLSAATGDTVTMTETQFASARNGTSGVIVTGTMTDGSTFSDKISVVRVSDGAAGADGSNGLHNATIQLFKRSATAPAVPSATTTYTFSTAVLTGITNGWTQSVPAANGNPLYVTSATAAANTATDTIGTAEWATPVIMAQDGTNGTDGTNLVTIMLYKRSATTPALPSATTTYTFSTQVLSGITNGWTQAVPAVNGNPCYITTATALATASATTDTIASTEWASPAVFVQDGVDGAGGPVIGLTASPTAFYWVDGIPISSTQSVTFTATRQNTSETVNFSSSPSVTLTGSGLTRTLSLANFGTNSQVTVTATGATSGATATVTVFRIDRTTSGSIIGDGDFGGGTFFDPVAGVTPWRKNGGFVRTQIP
jgi:hypothetical protein